MLSPWKFEKNTFAVFVCGGLFSIPFVWYRCWTEFSLSHRLTVLRMRSTFFIGKRCVSEGTAKILRITVIFHSAKKIHASFCWCYFLYFGKKTWWNKISLIFDVVLRFFIIRRIHWMWWCLWFSRCVVWFKIYFWFSFSFSFMFFLSFLFKVNKSSFFFSLILAEFFSVVEFCFDVVDWFA